MAQETKFEREQRLQATEDELRRQENARASASTASVLSPTPPTPESSARLDQLAQPPPLPVPPPPPTPAQQIATLKAELAEEKARFVKQAATLSEYKTLATRLQSELANTTQATGPQHLDAVVAYVSMLRGQLNRAVPGATW